MSLVANTAPTMTKADKAVTTSPINIFVGVLGSLFLLLKKPQIPTITGVSNTTQNGLIDWYNSVEYSFKSSPLAGIFYFGRLLKYILDFFCSSMFELNAERSANSVFVELGIVSAIFSNLVIESLNVLSSLDTNSLLTTN